MGFEGIGASVRRKEDLAFPQRPRHNTPTTSTGRASSTRSSALRPRRMRADPRIDAAAAKAAPGVVAVFTGADMEADGIGGLPCGWQIHSTDGSPMVEPPHPVLAQSARCGTSAIRSRW